MTPARALVAPVVWCLASLLLLTQRAGDGLGAFLEAYDRGATRLGRATLRLGRRLVVLLGPLGRLLRTMTAPLWRALRALWQWANVKVLMRMFRPLSRFGRWLTAHAGPLVTRLVHRLRRLMTRFEPLVDVLMHAVETVESAAARLAAGWRRAWAPVLATTARWRRPSRG